MDIKQRASNKVFSKVYFTKIEIEDYKKSIRNGLHGGVTETEIKVCLKATEQELKVWNYIAELIEKNNN
mgnify:CR=1 FL=1|tara:strand:+ start:107 stop:313 length:207 start_codon:yes stop_codon:yes gene_type:complete